jgi:hypothetical protein
MAREFAAQQAQRPRTNIRTIITAQAKIQMIANGTVVRPGELPQIGPHPDLVLPDRPEDPDTVQGERGAIVSQLGDDGRIIGK